MATYKSIRYNVDYQGKAGSLMPLSLFTSDGSDATADFTSKIDSTYDEYLFIFNSIHPQTDNVFLSFNGSDDTSSHSYDITKTTTFFRAYNNEGDDTTILGYATGSDLAESTAFQVLEDGNSNDSDHASSGFLYLFNPSSTTFVKHFIARMSSTSAGDFALQNFTAGYFNTTAAITALQFKFSSGEIQAGTIGMFGVT
jgi:hypothetical protein